MNKRTQIIVAAAAALAASPALAHTGAGNADGFSAGLAHPLFGADHLLAMLSVGVWSALAAPRRAWIAPLAFVAAMIAGAWLAFAGIGLPAVESMIAASVLVSGLMIVAGARLPLAVGVALCGLFAAFHGHAHAAEATGGVFAYIIGFAISTAAIHAVGIGIGIGTVHTTLLRHGVGLAVAGSGIALLAG